MVIIGRSDKVYRQNQKTKTDLGNMLISFPADITLKTTAGIGQQCCFFMNTTKPGVQQTVLMLLTACRIEGRKFQLEHKQYVES